MPLGASARPTRVDVLICSYLSNWKFPSAPTRPAGLRCAFEAFHPTPLVVLAGRSPKASFRPLSYSWVVYVGAFAVGLVASRGKSRRGVPLLGAAACPGRLPMWTEGCSYFLRLFFFGISDVARFSARGCCCWGPPRALGGLHGGVLTFYAFVFLGHIGCRQQREIRKRGWEWGLGGFLGRAEAPSGMVIPR